MRVAVFGASGKVGRQALQHLLFNSDDEVDITLVSKSPDRVRGMVADITSALPLLGRARASRAGQPRIDITGDASALRGSDLVVVVSGRWPSREQAREIEVVDPTGRLLQSYVNFDMVQDICRMVARNAPKAAVLMVTNQSDMMAAAAREILPPERVLGMGGMVDSARFRLLSARATGRSPRGHAEGDHMIGYHNGDMIPLASSLSFPVERHLLEEIVRETREYGGMVSALQRHPSMPDVDSGASVLPGYAVYATIAAWTGLIGPIEEVFNVVLPRAAAARYGTEANGALGVPVRVGAGSYEIITRYDLTVEEQRLLRRAQEKMNATYARLVDHVKRGAHP
jgi:malate dehydrogenase